MRVVITSFGSLGDLNPYIGLCRALNDRGNEAVLAVPRLYVPHAIAAGVNAHPVRPDIDPDRRDVIQRVMHPFRGAEYLIREWLMPNVDDAYADLDALVKDDDILVSHPLTFAAPVLAEHRRLRWASSVLAPLGFFSRCDPPLMAVHPLVAALQRNLPGLYRHLVQLPRMATRSWGKPVRELRARLGLPAGQDPVHGGQFSPHLNLAMFSPLLAEPQPDWPPDTVVTGAVSYDAVHGGMSPELEAFLDRGSAPVVFTLGSSAVAGAFAPAFYRASIEAVRDRGARAVLLIGPQSEFRMEGARDDICIAEWAPHSALFARASAIVHPGGAGTLHTALRSGRPMLIVPHAHDQGDNALRAARLGVARVVFPSQYNRRTVGQHLRELAQPGWSERSATVAQRVRREDGASRAVDALEALAGQPANHPARPVVSMP
ncbi:MAG TPA: glycosyltransferase [Gemmatimonadaceae bacterium]